MKYYVDLPCGRIYCDTVKPLFLVCAALNFNPEIKAVRLLTIKESIVQR